MSFKPTMHGSQKSDGLVVPMKSSNEAGRAVKETTEGRSPVEGNMDQQNALRTQSRGVGAPSELARVRSVARKDKGAKFTALLHHVTQDRLRAAFFELKKKAAPGVDGVTWQAYSEGIDERIFDLHGRVHRGAYRANPSRRVFIPKTDGSQRPLGIASLEDKIVQRAVVDVLNAIYEEDFLGFSYGFRPGRSQHHALDALATGILRKRVKYVLDADIRGFFDSIDHGWLMKFVEHRIADKRLLRLLRKWLAAGVLENGTWAETNQGSPQGATISPLLANVFLHYVFDLWAQQWRKRTARGNVVVVRYADDSVVGFEYHADAVQFLADLRDRMRKFSLELHAEKTRLLEFGRYAAANRKERGLHGAPETFDFLGFTHICGRTRDGRSFFLLRQTMRKRMQATLRRVRDEMMRRRHLSVYEQGKWIGAVVRGYFAYHAVPANYASLAVFQKEVQRRWLFALRRRSQVGGPTWEQMRKLSDRWIPRPKILHPFPEQRFDARTRDRSRVR